MNLMALTQDIKQIAIKSDLDLVGIAHADPFEGYRWYDSAMCDPKLEMTEARSIVVAGINELKFLKETKIKGLIGKVARSYAAGHEFNLVELTNLSEQQFRERFGKLNWSIDFNTFKRNVLIAIANEAN